MELQVKGVIKAIGKREYFPSRKYFPGKVLSKIGVLIETSPKQCFCFYLTTAWKMEDKTKWIEAKGLKVGDRVECTVAIVSRQWQYTFITNVYCLEIIKVKETII